MKIIFEYFRLFTIIMLNNKVGFVWYLIFPLVAFFGFNYAWITTKPDLETFHLNSSLFLSYITFAMSMDVTTNLIAMRENGFLKMFKFVSGSKYAIALGKLFNQMVFLLLSVFLFSCITGIVFLNSVSDFTIYLLISLIACFVGALLVSLFSLILMLLPIKQESLTTILNMLLFTLFFLSANGFSSANLQYGFILVFINPLDYIRNLTFLTGDLLGIIHFEHLGALYIILIGVAYLFIGLIGLKNFNIVSRTSRT